MHGQTGELIPQYQPRLLIGDVIPFEKPADYTPSQDPATFEQTLGSTLEMKDDKPKKTRTTVHRPRKDEVMIEVDVGESGPDGLGNVIEFLNGNSGPKHVRLIVRNGSATAAVELGKDLTVGLTDKIRSELENFNGVGEIRTG